MGFISSSRVYNIVMTSFLRKEENSEKPPRSREDRLWPSAVFIPVFTPLNDPFYLFASNGSIYCQDSPKCVSARCRLKMFDRGARWKHLPRWEASLPLSPAPEPAVLIAHYLSDYDAPLSEAGDYTTKYHLLRNLFSLYHSECCVLLLRRAPHLLSLFLSSPFHLLT